MQTVIFETPGLFGDHHVSEVRKQLLNMPGITDINASSAFRVVEVTFDETQISRDAIQNQLQQMGYLDELPFLLETGVAAQRIHGDSFFRHTASYATLKKTVSFQQTIPYSGRPLWTCPGIGTIKPMDN